jgi:hypothetical protein
VLHRSDISNHGRLFTRPLSVKAGTLHFIRITTVSEVQITCSGLV